MPETSTTPESAAVDRPELRKILQEMVDSGFLGVTLRVNTPEGEWTGAAGLAERDGTATPPVDGHIRVGSNTKTFTAALALLLVTEGVLELDAPVAKTLTDYDLDDRITLRMLLQHTSGVFNFTGEIYEDGTFVPGVPFQGKEWVEGRFKSYAPEELARLALSKPARFEPGADWSYANTNYTLVRLLIAKATGRPFADEMRRLVLDPLELTGTSVPEGATDLPEPHAHAYYRYEDGGTERTVDVTRQDPSWISTGGDMVSTTADLRTFITALVTGRLVPADLLAEMLTTHPKAGYGLGVFVQEPVPGVQVVTHNGGIAGHGALMFTTTDGATTLTAGLNYTDDKDLSMSGPFQKAVADLLPAVFGGGPATETQA
ncbi:MULTISPECIES: serine hydrolase domain-containing protein [unclassified Streptomyces]|uniref:serine hydrolase domain-containing protein n=1 Tax=unclassified Streptomyces TaxID=2593676 RepID=UPI002E183F9C